MEPSELRRLTAVAAAMTATAALLAGTAAAWTSMYAGPKTWLPGYDASGSYGDQYLITNVFENRSITSWARVAYIDTSGNWSCSTTSYSTLTGC